MDSLIFVLMMVVFFLLRGIPKEKRTQLLLRFEYELYKRGFIEYRD